MTSTHTNRVLRDVAEERIHQEEKWGEQNHVPDVWLAILSEEVGELATEMLHHRFGGKEDGKDTHQYAKQMREEAIQVAAVAVAFVECLDRNEGAGRGAILTVLPGKTDELPAEPSTTV